MINGSCSRKLNLVSNEFSNWNNITACSIHVQVEPEKREERREKKKQVEIEERN